VESAIVDTRIFQRLRYIRQNGLLHFVFPSAVHTRFAHSIGTMHIAIRVADNLFGVAYENATRASERKAIDYLAMVFRCAALLHDVGHCAFSHSIERVEVNGSPLLGTLSDLFGLWKESELLKEYTATDAAAGTRPVTHEQIGLALTRRIFMEDNVGDACKAMKWNAKMLGQDVRALMAGALKTSTTFNTYAGQLAPLLPGNPKSLPNPAEDLAEALHSLVSGTLDVDRLDYLIRDSFFCGVPYGRCDVSVLVDGLSLGIVEDRIWPLLHRKAVHALDDMLWSRYQLFIQVLNHKTNVGLNAALNHAIEPALNANYIENPKQFESFVAFTDDHVMGNLLLNGMKGKLDEEIYIRILIDRRVPRHLGMQRVDSVPGPKKIQKLLEERATDLGIPTGEIFSDVASSTLVKPTSAFPIITEWDRNTRTRTLSAFDSHSTVTGPRGSRRPQISHHVVHFFSHR